MSSLSTFRFLLTAGTAVTLLSSCRIVNGRMDFFWIQEQFSPAIEDSVVVTSSATGAAPYEPTTDVAYTAPQQLPQPTIQPTAAPQPAPAVSVAQNQPAATPPPAPAPAPAAESKSKSWWLWWQKAPKAAPAPRTYVVAKGDTLSLIARKHRVTLRALLQANGIAPENADTLRDGQILNIPDPAPRRKKRAVKKEEPETQAPQETGTQTPDGAAVTPAATAAAPAPASAPAAATTTAPAVTLPTIVTPPPAQTTPAPAPAPTAAPQAPAPAAGVQVYTVLKGDTMTSIARKHGITVPALLQANGIAPEKADTLRDGQTLNIPQPTR